MNSHIPSMDWGYAEIFARMSISPKDADAGSVRMASSDVSEGMRSIREMIGLL